MGNKWKKAKQALGLNTCFSVPPRTLDHDPPSDDGDNAAGTISDAVNVSSPSGRRSVDRLPPISSSSSSLRLSRTHSKPSKKTCAICLTSMKSGNGHAIFTAECSHTFHFHCITSNVKHGNRICPVCRAKWKEVPLQTSSSSDLSHGRSRINPVNFPQDNTITSITSLMQQLYPPNQGTKTIERAIYNDDELLPEFFSKVSADMSPNEVIEVKTFAEVSAVPKSTSHNNFTALVHLKAPPTPVTENTSVPIDLVTVLDVSGSMAGTKLALLKRAMGFVIQNLGPLDRLSVISFSCTARRVLSLTRMTDYGKQQALTAVNMLCSNGGTNIAEGLKKGAKVILDRNYKNSVSSIMLLSDGQDTYAPTNNPGPGGEHQSADYQWLLPFSVHSGGGAHPHIPVHAFGFGLDHDAALMHSISEMSGGTFSFIDDAEGVIQDAFAQCIGGLLSVVVQELQVQIECVDPNLKFTSIKAGSYQSRIASDDARTGFISVGELYAEEQRDFLVMLDNIPVDENHEMSLIKVKCIYTDPITKNRVNLEESDELKIQRPEKVENLVVSKEVDRQRNRVRASEAIAEARVAAENNDLATAVSVIGSCLRAISETVSAQNGDELCVSLCAELKEMQEKMASRRVYEETGRAYVLSGMSSHSWQRATTNSTNLTQAYQTPSMTQMVTHSQTFHIGNTPARTQP